jgi:alginate O-acetyltransferase complex protein AlgI
MESTSIFYLLGYLLVSILLTLFFKQKNKWKALLISSFLFYTLLVEEQIFFFLLYSIWIYFLSLKITQINNCWAYIILSLAPLLLIKFTLRESHFENYSIVNLEPASFNIINYINIIGISYFTFNSISYLIDIKRKYIEPNKDYFQVLLYLIYFPTIFAGPLHRAKYLFLQFKNTHITNASLSNGLRLILWGLFKSLVISQRIFGLITYLENDTTGVYYLLLGFLFFLYLYCNFSAFVDFFQGFSEVFNIKLKNNFKNRVYFANSRQNFWKGWHITLNEWFRDYFFYIIIKYDRKRKYTNWFLLLTFLLIAIWHGFTQVLIIWGLLNGLWIITEKKVNFKLAKKYSFLGTIYHLALASFIATIFISKNLNALFMKLISVPSINLDLKYCLTNSLIIIISFLIMDYHYAKAGEKRIDEYLGEKKVLIRWFIYVKLIVLILLFSRNFGINNYYTQF